MSAVRVQIVSMDGVATPNGPAWITDDDGTHTPIDPVTDAPVVEHEVDIRKLAETCLENSERWFPSNHESFRGAVTHCTLGLAGEAGETANKVKKFFGYTDQREQQAKEADAIIEELIDTLIYDLVLLSLFRADIPAELARKIAICEARWGAK